MMVIINKESCLNYNIIFLDRHCLHLGTTLSIRTKYLELKLSFGEENNRCECNTLLTRKDITQNGTHVLQQWIILRLNTNVSFSITNYIMLWK